MDYEIADATFHPHDGPVLPRQTQERRVIHALDVTILLGRDCLPVPLRQREQRLSLIAVRRALSKFLREKSVNGHDGFIGYRGNNARCLDRSSNVMNEENKDAD